MKIISWTDFETGIKYRAAFVPDNKTTVSRAFKIECMGTDMVGKPAWVFCKTPELKSLAWAVIETPEKTHIEEEGVTP